MQSLLFVHSPMVVSMGVAMAMVGIMGGDTDRDQGRQEETEMEGDHLGLTIEKDQNKTCTYNSSSYYSIS